MGTKITKNIRQCTTCAHVPDILDDAQAGGQKIACPLELQEGTVEVDGEFCPSWALNPNVSFIDDEDVAADTVKEADGDEVENDRTEDTEDLILPYVFVDYRLIKTSEDAPGAIHTSVLLASRYNVLVELLEMGVAKVKAEIDASTSKAVVDAMREIEDNDGTSSASLSSLLEMVMSLGVELPEDSRLNMGKDENSVLAEQEVEVDEIDEDLEDPVAAEVTDDDEPLDDEDSWETEDDDDDWETEDDEEEDDEDEDEDDAD